MKELLFSAKVTTAGPVLWVLCVLSVVALSLIFYKLLRFRLAKLKKVDFVPEIETLVLHGEDTRALGILSRESSPLARVLEEAICSKGDLQEESGIKDDVLRVGNLEIRKLEEFLRPIGIIAQLSPLLGLMGTVFGMIEAFQQIEISGGRAEPSLLAGGIWQALLTTAMGLAIAIPSIAAYNYFEGEIEKVESRMRDTVAKILSIFRRRSMQTAQRNPTEQIID